MGDEIGGENRQKLLIRGRICHGKSVHGIDQPDAEINGPDAIDESAGEIGIVRLHQPFKEGRAWVARRREFGPPQRSGNRRLTGRGIGQPP